METTLNSLFRLKAICPSDLDAFHRDGYILFPDIFKDEARENLINEILHLDSIRQYLNSLDEKPDEPQAYFVRPWNARGPCGDQLIDDP